MGVWFGNAGQGAAFCWETPTPMATWKPMACISVELNICKHAVDANTCASSEADANKYGAEHIKDFANNM